MAKFIFTFVIEADNVIQAEDILITKLKEGDYTEENFKIEY